VIAGAPHDGGVATVVFYPVLGEGEGEVERGVAGVADELQFVLR
jgi:hypothetical protein